MGYRKNIVSKKAQMQKKWEILTPKKPTQKKNKWSVCQDVVDMCFWYWQKLFELFRIFVLGVKNHENMCIYASFCFSGSLNKYKSALNGSFFSLRSDKGKKIIFYLYCSSFCNPGKKKVFENGQNLLWSKFSGKNRKGGW